MSNVGEILSPTPEKWATSQHQQPSGARLVNHAHLEKEMNKARSALAKHDVHTPEDTAGRAAKLTRAIAAHQALITAKHPIASHGWSPGHKIFGFTRKDHLGHVIKGGRKKRTRRHSRKNAIQDINANGADENIAVHAVAVVVAGAVVDVK